MSTSLTYNGEERIPADHATVWASVTDPTRVAQCLPDLIAYRVLDATHVDATVGVDLGLMKGEFAFRLELLPAADRQRMGITLSGGGFGTTVDLRAEAELRADAAGVTLVWTGSAVASGTAALLGGRLLDLQARKIITETFANVRRQLSVSPLARTLE